MAVIVTVDNHPNGGLTSERRIDLEYFKTPPGMVKVAQFVSLKQFHMKSK